MTYYGVFSNVSKRFFVGLKSKNKNELFPRLRKMIGYDYLKYRWEIKEIPLEVFEKWGQMRQERLEREKKRRRLNFVLATLFYPSSSMKKAHKENMCVKELPNIFTKLSQEQQEIIKERFFPIKFFNEEYPHYKGEAVLKSCRERINR